MLGKLFKWFLFALAGVVGLLVVALIVVLVVFPRSEPASDIALEATEARLARGEYLVRSVAFCLNCHSERDWDLYGAPIIASTEGRGAPLSIFRFTDYSGNITPFGIGDWTDGEVVRAITAGVNRDGDALHPFMPFDTYAGMSEEDIYSIVVHLRTLAPVEFVRPPHDLALPLKLITRTLPKPWVPLPAPHPSDSVAQGRYLARMAECDFCHRGDYSGGANFPLPDGGISTSSDLRPLPTGLGDRDREAFIGMFRAFATDKSRNIVVPEGETNTVMPWLQYATMKDDDLGAIYDYLRSLPTEVDR